MNNDNNLKKVECDDSPIPDSEKNKEYDCNEPNLPRVPEPNKEDYSHADADATEPVKASDEVEIIS